MKKTLIALSILSIVLSFSACGKGIGKDTVVSITDTVGNNSADNVSRVEISTTEATADATTEVPSSLVEEKKDAVVKTTVAVTSESKAETTKAKTTTQAETTSASANTDNGQTSDVFKMLDSLNYKAISCDGLPTYNLTASDGTVYLINFDEAWVWRRPSLTGDADNEAHLTKEVIDAIYANWDQLNIYPVQWNN